MNKVIRRLRPVSADAARLCPEEVARDVFECVTRSASIVHLHVRDEKARLTDDLTVSGRPPPGKSTPGGSVIQYRPAVSRIDHRTTVCAVSLPRIEMGSLNSIGQSGEPYIPSIGDVR
jgi:hypothetical protein